MDETDAIRQRHSVRQYKPDRIEDDKVALIKAKLHELNAEGNLHLQFIEDADKTYNKLFNKVAGLGSAPSVIACVGKDTPGLDQRVGYYGEKLVLYAQTLGLNTCWTGTFNRKNIIYVLYCTVFCSIFWNNYLFVLYLYYFDFYKLMVSYKAFKIKMDF